MTAAEARKKQWESLKDKPLSAKLKYIFTYYWPGILGGVCVLIFLVSWIGGIITQKEIALGGHLFNGLKNESYTGDFAQDFMTRQQIDTDEYTFRFSADSSTIGGTPDAMYASMEAIAAQIAVGDLDFLIGDVESFKLFTAYYADPCTMLTEAQLEKYKDLLVYVEKSEMDNFLSEELEMQPIPAYHMSAEGLENPIPIGIRLPENCRLRQAYLFPKGEVIFGFTQKVLHKENALAFLEYALDMTNTPTAP